MPARHTAKSLLLCAWAVGTSACQAAAPVSDLHRSLELSLRRTCVAEPGGPRADAADLFAGRIHTACFRWAHRQADRLSPR